MAIDVKLNQGYRDSQWSNQPNGLNGTRQEMGEMIKYNSQTYTHTDFNIDLTRDKYVKDIDLTEHACMKWILISTGHMVDLRSRDCRLCKEYHSVHYSMCKEHHSFNALYLCCGCPISEKTGFDHCAGIDWHLYNDNKRASTAYRVFENLMDVLDWTINRLEEHENGK